ncbi:FHA domain-containing protein [Streptomyces platensis]|uniref:FHA domain-containing protein n=1 Tax=Streptomyces platensis TaxID=58346 RepID=A0AAE6NGW7_STRPT|nr:FHA domain-containing protein [Streptomyces platensis]OSY41616.1 Glycogen accumulation regulator GarA [Streptomyces platensis]QEV52809.1 FHA domain-containing protein [Streptomyces platensis]
MQIRLTVLGPRSGHTTRACDVLVTAPSGTALAAVAGSLAASVAGSGADVGGAGGGSGPAVLYAGSERLDPQRAAIGEPPLIDGAVLSVQSPGPAPAHGLPHGSARLRVVSGPDAGGVHLLHGGQIRIGRSADADVPLDDPDVSRLHCTVTVEPDGSVSVADLRSTNGTVVDGTDLDEHPAPLPPGALLRLGESALRLQSAPDAPDPALPTTPDGEGHLRITPGAAGAVAGGRAQEYGAAGPHGATAAVGGAYAGAGAGAYGGAGAHAGAGAYERVTGGAAASAGGSAAGQVAGGSAHAPGAAQTRGGASYPPAGYPHSPAAASQPPAAPGRRDTPLRGTPAGYGNPAAYGAPAPGPDGSRPAAVAPYPDTSTGHVYDRTTDGGSPSAGWGPGVREPAGGFPATGHQRTHGGQQSLAPADEGPRKGGRRGGIGAWARRLASGRPALERPDEGRPPAYEPAGDPTAADADALDAPSPEALAGPAAEERWPDAAAILLTALGPGPRLWERGPDHPDTLTVRLGTAARSGGRTALPVTVELRRAGSLGLAGPRARLTGLARCALAQLAALHSPGTLDIVLISTDRARPAEERVADWSWLGWLPQVRPERGQDCRLLLAYDADQALARTSELVRRLDDSPLGPGWADAERAEITAAAARHRGPFTLVVVDGDPGTSALRETTARLAAGGAAAGIHLLCLAETPASSPAFPLSATYEAARTASPAFGECGAVAVLSGDVATALRVVQPGSGPNGTVATVDAVSGAWAERFARALAPLRETDATASAAGGGAAVRVAVPLPDSARLLDELGLARATPASLMARWAAALDTDRPGAAAVLGAGPHGPLCADLAADGSHLLLEGAAATGKTELLRSLAASLAAADRPDLLSMVLVDGGGSERGEGLRVCTDLPHVTTHLAASDPVRMREFAQALSSELKRRAEILAGTPFTEWRSKHLPAPRIVAPRRSTEGGHGEQEQITLRNRCRNKEEEGGTPADPSTTGTLRLRPRGGAPTQDPAPEPAVPMPRLFVLVDDFDALVAPALGSTGRPAAGSVVRALESVARDGAALGVHLIAATGHPDRTAETATSERADLRVQLGAATDASEPVPTGRGRLYRAADGSSTPFQAGRVTGRIPRTSTLRPTVVPLEWQRMGDPPARRPLRELGNGPTDLALLASALQRAAQSSGAAATPPLL